MLSYAERFDVMLKEASFYEKKENNTVHCFLCSHHCNIKEGYSGLCGVRKNEKGILYTLNYGELVAEHIDPIEKKPLFHFFPGSSAYSLAASGCNFKCSFCQNWQISQKEEAEKLGTGNLYVTPRDIVKKAQDAGCKSISYTYTEPTVYFEFAYDSAKLAREKGLFNNFVTNGFMSKDSLESIAPYLDAANVDLKSFRDSFYRKTCKAVLKPVLENIRLMKKLGIWIEVTTLIIPSLNDSKEELSDIASFIASVGEEIPWHISRFYPAYKFNSYSATPLKTLEDTYQIGKSKGLRYVYIGNLYTDYGENTYCYSCGELLIKRTGFFVDKNNILSGKCKFCGVKIDGVGM